MTAADDTFGAWFIGNQISIVAFGFLLLQCWVFFQNRDKEPFVLKLVVSLTLALGFFLIFLTSHALYHYLITSIGDPDALDGIVWSFKAEPWVSEADVTLAHLFYTVRIYYIQRSFLLPGVLLFLTISHTALDLTAAGLELSIKGIVAAKATAGLAQAGLSIDLTIDVIIMLAMFHFFYVNSGTQVKSTQSLIHKLALYTFASGSLTVVANVIILATFIRKPNTQIYSGVSFILPHLYSNCLLAMLNARSHLRVNYNTTGDHLSGESSEPSTLHISLPVFSAPKESTRSSTRASEQFSHGTYSFELGSMPENPTSSQMPGKANDREAFAV